MKLLKLLGIFILILGGAIGILLINSTDDTEIIDMEGFKDAEEIRSNIESYWHNASTWESEDFEAQHSKITRSNGSGWIDAQDAHNLSELLYTLVINRMEKLLVEEYAKSDCKADIIGDLMKGIDAVCQKQPAYSNDPKVKELRNCYELFKGIGSFAKMSFNPDCKLTENPDGTHKWVDYSSYEASMNRKAKDYRENPLYTQYLSNITRLKDGIDASKVTNRLKSGKTAYSSKLANELATIYNSIADSEVSETTFSLISKDYSKFYKEFGSYNSAAKEVLKGVLDKINNQLTQNSKQK